MQNTTLIPNQFVFNKLVLLPMPFQFTPSHKYSKAPLRCVIRLHIYFSWRKAYMYMLAHATKHTLKNSDTVHRDTLAQCLCYFISPLYVYSSIAITYWWFYMALRSYYRCRKKNCLIMHYLLWSSVTSTQFCEISLAK